MDTLPIILGGLTACSVGGGFVRDRYRRLPPDTPYDIVIRVNSLESLQTHGWEILLGDTARNAISQRGAADPMNGVVVAILGSYNRGKSFVINQLCKTRLSSDNLIQNEEISIVTAKGHTRDVTFIDTAGSDTAMPRTKLDDKKATDALLREIAFHLASFVIIVVNRLRATDHTYIQQVVTQIKNSKRNQQIMVIHNLLDVKTIEDVNTVINREVKGFFEATPTEMRLPKSDDSFTLNKFFISKDGDIELRHFILTQLGSPSAQEWNAQSLQTIMTILQTATNARRNLDVISEMIAYVNVKLPQIFLDSNENGDNTGDENQRTLHVSLHKSKPFIVLSQRSDMEHLDQSPYPLKLSSGLVYDDAGYFLGTNSINKGHWQPNYNYYETDSEVHVIVELAGFRKIQLDTQVKEEIITVTGHRDDFKKDLNDPVIRQEQVSIGTFKLEIPLKSPIRENGTKVERDKGFYKITCQKKRATAEHFD